MACLNSKALIARYEAAYLAANKKPIEVTYINGWYRISSVVDGFIENVRHSELEFYTEVLEKRNQIV